MNLTGEAIVAAMDLAGFPQSSWVNGVAIALAESGGNTTATHKNSNGSTDFGVWQINSVHADLLATHNWKDPVDNARMAASISSNGSNWKPWSTFNSGSYKSHLSAANTAVNRYLMKLGAKNPNLSHTDFDKQILSSSGVDSTSADTPVDTATSSLASSVQLMTQRSTWIRIGMFVAGSTMILGGAYWLVINSSAAKSAINAVLDVVPGGRAVKGGVKGFVRGKVSGASKRSKSAKRSDSGSDNGSDSNGRKVGNGSEA